MSYQIIGSSEYGTEEVDEFDTRKEARDIIPEYQMAYGPGWSFKVVKSK